MTNYSTILPFLFLFISISSASNDSSSNSLSLPNLHNSIIKPTPNITQPFHITITKTMTTTQQPLSTTTATTIVASFTEAINNIDDKSKFTINLISSIQHYLTRIMSYLILLGKGLFISFALYLAIPAFRAFLKTIYDKFMRPIIELISTLIGVSMIIFIIYRSVQRFLPTHDAIALFINDNFISAITTTIVTTLPYILGPLIVIIFFKIDILISTLNSYVKNAKSIAVGRLSPIEEANH